MRLIQNKTHQHVTYIFDNIKFKYNFDNIKFFIEKTDILLRDIYLLAFERCCYSCRLAGRKNLSRDCKSKTMMGYGPWTSSQLSKSNGKNPQAHCCSYVIRTYFFDPAWPSALYIPTMPGASCDSWEMDPNERGSTNMERAKMFLGVTPDESEAVSRLAVPERQAGEGKSFFDAFALAGMRVVRVEPGLVVCSFKVPPRLTVSHLINSLPSSFGYGCK